MEMVLVLVYSHFAGVAAALRLASRQRMATDGVK